MSSEHKAVTLSEEELRLVRRFSVVMASKLIKNRSKGSVWNGHTLKALLKRLREEVDELESAVNEYDALKWGLMTGPKPADGAEEMATEKDLLSRGGAIALEAADVANFCAMIADNAGGLR